MRVPTCYFPGIVFPVICLTVIGNCEKFIWNNTIGLNSSTPSQITSRRWENPTNWLVDNSIATRYPCQKDNVYFPLGYTYPPISINSQARVLGMNWRGRNVSALEEIDNWKKYFVLQAGGDLAIDPDCGGRPVCECRTQNSSRVIRLVIAIVIVLILIATGSILLTSSVLLYVLIRKLILAKKRKSGQVFTFQTLNEFDVEDEVDRFDVTVVSNEEFPSGKAKIPEDLTGLLDEDSMNGDVQGSGERTQKYKNIPEDKQALLADSSQDITTAEELMSESTKPGNQTDL